MNDEQPHPPAGHRVLALVEVMDTLRRQCPWDAGQTHASLAKYLIEEAYETLETIEHGDLGTLREELGDVLLQVVFHARIAQERGPEGFTIDDVADAIIDKLTRRHPHVFGGADVAGVDDVRANWETIKAAERVEKGQRDASILEGVPFGQPAALLGYELQKRAVRNGLPEDLIADDGGPGGELFAAVDAERRRAADPEMDLRAAARRFDGRVRAAEAKARADGRDPRELTPEQWRAYWD
ncbi:nucleoside triphosphate pyrophosphohydrolase [Marinitenerispora sediminis]|uniref:Nucleotide pyrophosphohydrolase n=1 Tax=Marinitenerispora sediminis TaxID=1931232 RepID=A0A368T485_9ACTN|nr:MazG family protein [Marinitenerispora sediminis]RCV56017.1 nucleotide pyrophosphohydrolase [Marinitenerispora sediminis]RCV57748.1 nucleotide pyrophosphohydrolase [Marinitenerispora sediminis]RCV60995.1 nucleotide pyrophosphohydrolase [Marinitenerispora sediminis]